MTPGADKASIASWPEPLRRAFAELPSESDWIVALSGGLDSVVLLDLARRWRIAQGQEGQLRALHINHGLLAQSDDWAERCRVLCDSFDVALATINVKIDLAGNGLEDAARAARYRAFANHLGPGEALLLAHHADDQAETQLYRMMRGAGLAGFAGMPESRRLGAGTLYRPLLAQTRQQLRTLADEARLSWVEDPSNKDERYDRNFLRCQVMPLLKGRWPGVSGRMALNARHGREALTLLDERARDDARAVIDPQNGDLLLTPLRLLSGPRRRNLVQWWLRQRGLTPLSEKHLTTAFAEFIDAPEDASPSIAWDGMALRRYGNRALVLDCAAASANPESRLWKPPGALPWAGGILHAEHQPGQGLAVPSGPLRVTTRQGGERLELASGQHQPLKKWLQAQRLPPWERAIMPLLWSGESLVAVADRWLHPRFRAGEGQPGWVLRWQAPDLRAAPRGGPGQPILIEQKGTFC